MHKWYDGKSPSCDACGWLKKDSFPNGEEYEACRWFAHIFHTTTQEPCEFALSPIGVKQYIERNKPKNRKK